MTATGRAQRPKRCGQKVPSLKYRGVFHTGDWESCGTVQAIHLERRNLEISKKEVR